MKTFLFISYLTVTLFLLVSCNENVQSETKDQSGTPTITEAAPDEITEIKLENLLRDTLALADGIEVILSYVEVPKGATLPYHYHPGEEYAYLIEGSGVLSLKDQSEATIKAGEAGKVPLKTVHSFHTTDESARMVVFRVHEQGQPERVLVEE